MNQNRGAPNNPPQKQNIDVIDGLTQEYNAIQIYNVEFFLRNLGALGGCTFHILTYLCRILTFSSRSDFQTTSNIFQATALRVQNLLAEITPDVVPDETNSIPMIFNNWLRNLISTYPSGCT